MNWIKNWFRTRTKKFNELEAEYETLDIIHSSLVELYEELREENEYLKNLYNNLKVDFNSLNEEYRNFRLAQEEKKKKLKDESYLLQENEKLTSWISSILKAFGEQRLANCNFPITIPFFEHNNKAVKDETCGWLFAEEGKAGYISTKEIIVPELHIVLRGIHNKD